MTRTAPAASFPARSLRFLSAALFLLAGNACRAQFPQQWAFDPPRDTFSPKAAFDLRSLNEKAAGESGFVKRTADGNDFALGNGKPVRFWAVDEYVQNTGDANALAHKARWLAKRGVNMVRVHSVLAPTAAGSKITDVNQDEVSKIWKLVAAMKKEGIYTTVSPYWAIPVKIQDSWNIPGGSGQSAAALVFWDPTFQQGYKAWLRALYAPVNPGTGLPLAKDPAVALIQIQNEDSMLFWTMQGVKGPQLTELLALYGDWLKNKYGSIEKAVTAWGGEHPGLDAFQDKQSDDPAQGRMGIYIVWEWTQPQTGYKAKRLADQLAFFADTMYRFNAETARYLRDDLGCKQLVNAGNWRPADPVKLFDAERYSYTANDVMGVNRYFTGVHEGPDNGWAIRPGDKFTNASVLLDPRSLPINNKQPLGYPFILPETEWVAPTLYQSEGPFLTAAYQSLTGVDISYFFADGDVAEWQPPFLPLPWNPPTGKWGIATPMQLGQFPAAALLFRKGYVRRGKPAVHEERALQDIWQRRSTLLAEEGGYDPNRDAGDLPPHSGVKGGADTLAFLVGPVEVKYGGDPAKSAVLDLKPYIDNGKKTVRSVTGEILFDHKRGVCLLNSPMAQGATGFLSKTPMLLLTDVTLKCANDYASLLVVPLDGKPIRTSRKLLVQVGTVARPTGWADKPATWTSGDGKTSTTGLEVVGTGKNPWQIAATKASLTVKNKGLTAATLLDANFNVVSNVPVRKVKEGVSLTLPPQTMYLVLR